MILTLPVAFQQKGPARAYGTRALRYRVSRPSGRVWLRVAGRGFLRDFRQRGNEVGKFFRRHHESSTEGGTERVGFRVELASQKFEAHNAGFDGAAEQPVGKERWRAVASYWR